MSSDGASFNGGVQLEFRELVGLYLFLRDHEAELDECLEDFLTRAERELFRQLSIAEMEQLKHTYCEGSHNDNSNGKNG